MNNDLMTLPELPVAKYTETEESWKDVVTASSWLKRVQLFGANSDAVKEGKIPMAHWGYVQTKDAIDDLGATFDCLPISWRFRAMLIGGDTILSYYNPKAKEFTDLIAKSEIQNSGAVYGIEFLVWIPCIKAFGSLYLNSKTARREAPALKALLKKGVTAKSQLIKTERYSWHGPVFVPCTTPFELPPVEDVIKEAEKFANPKESEVEPVSTPAGSSERVR